ncbi:hypothetical protein D039_3060A, partial [Vibrio parahaemolyticus EKP-028]
MNWAHRQSH